MTPPGTPGTMPAPGTPPGMAPMPATPPLDRPGASPALAEAFKCGKPEAASTPRRLWRLSKEQYTASIWTLFHGRMSSTRRMPSDYGTLVPWDPPNPADRFSNLAWSYSMGDGEMRLAYQAARELSTRLVAAIRQDSGRSCIGKIPLGDCVKQLVTARGPLLYRRPLTADEVTELVTTATTNQPMLGDDRAIAVVFQMLLMSPHFLYRVELGLGPAAGGANRLDPYELAAALSLGLADAPPDEELWKAAEAGQLGTAAELRAHVERLLRAQVTVKPETAKDDTPGKGPTFGSHPILQRFFAEYVPYRQVFQVFKEPSRYRFHDPEKLVSDTEHLIRDLLNKSGRKDFLKTLLTTSDGYVHGNSLPSYNLDKTFTQDQFCKNTGDHNCARANPVMLPTGQRAGLLTQPSFLAALSKPEETEPVQRGRFVAETLLCRTVPELPIGQVPQLPNAGPITMREKLVQHSKDPGCAACHSLMDDLGLALESFDHLGRYRELESGKPIDASGELSGTGDRDGPFKNGVELLDRLAGSRVAGQCFVRHSFAYWMGRPDAAGDACALTDAFAAYQKGGDYVELIASLFTSRSFLYRSMQ
jgi:hypothetical protein